MTPLRPPLGLLWATLRFLIAWVMILGIMTPNMDFVLKPEWALPAMIIMVWIDAMAGKFMRNRVDNSPKMTQAGELFADFFCFIFVPALWILQTFPNPYTVASVSLFVLCGGFRLVRFHHEGLIENGYRGLPVTYNGYAVPLLWSVIHFAELSPIIFWPLGLILLSWLMISTRFVVPEF
ncbi:hypothetical protein CBD41_07550 [bacterium TMED181]|nr:hypothetical protein [Planctomycetota bacterium]OUW43214.1 MAG: hypothetical protein CBD41_07550 [bacterium TMED181]